MFSKQDIESVLKSIPDPELGISIYDLGLIYEVKIEKGNVNILMTLTTMGCPLFSLIADPIKKQVSKLSGVKSVEVELTFDPPWSIEKMTPEAKAQLGMG
ncbi:metal-sulfur cluster assembly factor [Candidatus Gottesmanbacteria bacterium]|nr:metal-sulfur cluster assembly factor [Candidatus Gottesmanbacteria bacterium]